MKENAQRSTSNAQRPTGELARRNALAQALALKLIAQFDVGERKVMPPAFVHVSMPRLREFIREEIEAAEAGLTAESATGAAS